MSQRLSIVLGHDSIEDEITFFGVALANDPRGPEGKEETYA
jgi:hypothetical protein